MTRSLKDYPAIALKPEDLDGKIDFLRIFGRPGPIHVEIGTGKATFLLNQAKAQPHINFLGIERAGKYYRHAVDRIGRWDLNNVRIIRTDAAKFIADLLPDNSVDCFHIYFPDPWPKKRHHKRRLFTPANLTRLIRCLKPLGTVKITTDHAEYFEQIRQVIDTHPGRLEEIEFLPAADADQGQLVGTNYERKYLKEKRPIFHLAVRKT